MSAASGGTFSDALRGVAVLVTRPEGQAGPFIERLQKAGAEAIALPTIEISAVTLSEEDRIRLHPDNFEWVIYTSANAVRESLVQWPKPAHAGVAAVGRATANALESNGIRPRLVPRHSQDSEGLLAAPELTNIRGQRILLVRGLGGRELLRDELTRRGANVEVAELYRRSPARLDEHAVKRLKDSLSSGQRSRVAVTSVAILDALLGSLPPGITDAVRGLPLVVPGRRVAAEAQRRGWRGRLIVASSAEDSAMFQALEADAAVNAVGGA